jgi:diguanylate cyclase (GGDEF)-like protein
LISLRKHIDNCHNTLTESTLAAFRSALMVMAECGCRAVPGAGTELHRNLAGIHGSLSQTITPRSLDTATEQVTVELSKWADRAFQHHEQNEREIREIIGTVAKTAECVGNRDERFAVEIGGVAGRLRSIAEIDDIAVMRRSIIESTAALKSCVEKMAEENRISVGQLTSQVAEYRARLEKSEFESAIDPLTGLANRRAFERRLESQIAQSKPFCLILLDMDNFKAVNDRYGHVAGDDLLRKFGAELRAQFAPTDLVARWGGDEFTALVSGSLAQAEAKVENVRRWTLGEYKIDTGERTVKAHAGASIGVVAWKSGENGVELLDRADKCVYRAKASTAAGRVPSTAQRG